MSGRFGSRVLETVLGMASIYFLLAMFCGAAHDRLMALLSVRSALLEKSLTRSLGGAAQRLYEHPAISAMMHDGEHSEHIAAGAFAKALLDLATPNQPGAIEFADLERGIASDLPARRAAHFAAGNSARNGKVPGRRTARHRKMV